MNGDCNICINGKLPSYSASCVECGLLRKNYKPMTNADRIRAMSDEELAEFMKPYDSGCPRWNGKEPMPCSMRTNCRDCWLDWLKSPVEVDE